MVKSEQPLENYLFTLKSSFSKRVPQNLRSRFLTNQNLLHKKEKHAKKTVFSE